MSNNNIVFIWKKLKDGQKKCLHTAYLGKVKKMHVHS